MRCALKVRPDHALSWAYIAVAQVTRLRIGKSKPTSESIQRIVKELQWALRLAPTNPEILDMVLAQIRYLSPHWALSGFAAGDHARFVEQLSHRLHGRYQSTNASEWFHRGLILELQGHKEKAWESFLHAWELEPTNERYTTTMFVVVMATGNTTVARQLWNKFSADETLANFRVWLQKARAGADIASISSVVLRHSSCKTKANYSLTVSQRLESFINSQTFRSTAAFVAAVRATMATAATPRVCEEVRSHIGPSHQRVGLMYHFGSMPAPATALRRLSLQSLRTRLFPNPHNVTIPTQWVLDKAPGTSQQRFPAFMVNQLVALCTSEDSSSASSDAARVRFLSHLMDSAGLDEYLISHPNTDINAPDDLGNTAAHIAASQHDLLTLSILSKHGADVQNLRNMWGLSAVDMWVGDDGCEDTPVESPSKLDVVAEVLPRGWVSHQQTVPWGPLATWRDDGLVDIVDATEISLAAIIKGWIAPGKPVVIRNALAATVHQPECRDALRLYVQQRIKR